MHKLRILARAEMALAQIRVKRTGFQAALIAVAGFFALVGIALFNLAAYNALVPRLGPALAALAVGGANLLLAAIAVIVALKARPGSAERRWRERSVTWRRTKSRKMSTRCGTISTASAMRSRASAPAFRPSARSYPVASVRS